MVVDVMSSMEFVRRFGVNTEEHPLYRKFYEMYQAFLRQGVAAQDSAQDEDYIPSLAVLAEEKKFTQKRENGNTTYGGQSEIWLAVDVDQVVAFLTAHHYVDLAQWRSNNNKDRGVVQAKFPEVVYIAHFFSGRKGMGKYLVDHLSREAWRDCTLLLEVEHGIQNPTKLMRYYQETLGFIPCSRLAYDDYWRIYLMLAERNEYLTVRLRGHKEDLVLMKAGENVCEPNDERTWFIRPIG